VIMSKFKMVIEKEIPHGVGGRVLSYFERDHGKAVRDLETHSRLRIQLSRTMDPRLYISFNGDEVGMISEDGNSIRLIIDCAAGYDKLACLFARRFVAIIDIVCNTNSHEKGTPKVSMT